MAIGLGAVLLSLWFFSGLGSDRLRLVLSDAALPAAAVAAAAGCLWRSRNCHRQVRSTWVLLGLAALSWGIGQLYSSATEVFLLHSVPLPSPADAGYLGAVPLFAVALLRLSGAVDGLATRLRALLDGLLVAASLLVVSWVFVLGPMVSTGASSLPAQLVGLAYPIGDIVVATLVIYAALHSRAQRRALIPLSLIGVALIGLSVADSGFYYLSAVSQYSSGDPIDAGWLCGFLLLLVASRVPPATSVAEARIDERPRGLLLPYGAVIVAIGVTSVPGLRRPDSDIVVMLLRSSIMLFMVARQILTLRENRHLTDRLDQRVIKRTAELRANEQRFAALAQHSSDVVSIIDLDGCIHYQSKSSFDVLGYHPEELIGTSIARLLDDGSADQLQEAMTKVVDRALHSCVVELNVVHANGQSGVVEMTVTNLLAEPSVQGLVLNSRDISERKKLEDELVHQAFHDPLTGLANRALFQNRVEHALSRWQSGTVAILFLDLDGFKEINDSLGHAAGDLLLREVANRLGSCVRHGDTVSRFGGDEFAVLIDDVNQNVDPEGLAEKISERLSAGFVIEGREIEIRASAGIALCEGPDTTVGQLLRNADLAMYRAKTTRPGSYVTFDPEMHASLVERLELESDLRRAVRDGQLEVYYQPTVSVDSERLVSMEALVRWRHAERGFVPPLTFIPLAEVSGLIHEIGRQVLDIACHQLARWREAYPSFSELTVSVNVSGRQLQRDDFVAEVSSILASSRLDPTGLVLEITESVLLDDTEGSLTKLQQLKAMGIRLALDDFGTGYSSLSYLHRFPIDVLKIDKSFVDLLGLGTDQQKVVQTIIQLGANLRMDTIAEGVEHEAQIRALRDLGCHFAQGFHFSEAVPSHEIEPMLAASELNLTA